jgi:hypothetical protein
VPDDDVLRIGASFDPTPITAGMNTAANSVQSGCARMADQFRRSGLSADETATALKNLGYTAEEVAVAMGNVEQANKKSNQELEKSSHSFTQARISAQGFMQEVGIHGPRALTTFLAQSKAIGPILQAAFPVVAAIAFFEVLEMGYQKLIEVTSAMAGWDEEAKKMNAMLLELNEKTVEFNYNLAVEKLALSTIGLQGSSLDRQKEANLTAEQALRSKELTEAMQREQAIRAELAGNPHDVTVQNESGADETLTDVNTPSKERAKELNEELARNIQLQAQLGEELRKLVEVRKPEAAAETHAKEIEEAERYREILEKIYVDETTLTRESAKKDLDEMEKVRLERERNEEEVARMSEESAKKDLETFQRSAVEKSRIIEEQGKNEIEQIRASTEMQEKAIASTSTRGAGDPRINGVALTGYQQQVAVIQQMIAEEEKLRTVLQAGGATDEDPKMLESLAREQQLIQQLQIAWQKYGQTVESVAANEHRTWEKALGSMTQSFNQNFMQWVNGTERFGQAMEHVWTSLADTVILSLVKAGEQMIVNVALQKSLLESTKVSDASAAARHTYTSVSAIPIIGPFLAPEAAAVAFAAVMAFEKGGIVPRTDIAQVHKGEMVLPANISQSVQRMAESGQGGGGHTFNYNPTVHGSSAGGIKDMLDQHGKAFVDYALREMRRRHVG